MGDGVKLDGDKLGFLVAKEIESLSLPKDSLDIFAASFEDEFELNDSLFFSISFACSPIEVLAVVDTVGDGFVALSRLKTPEATVVVSMGINDGFPVFFADSALEEVAE